MKLTLAVFGLLAALFVAPLIAGCGSTTKNKVVVTVAPPAPTIAPSQSVTFTPTVTGTSTQTVTWAVKEGAAGGTITTAGVYKAPATVGTYHVTATSTADPTSLATATITVR